MKKRVQIAVLVAALAAAVVASQASGGQTRSFSFSSELSMYGVVYPPEYTSIASGTFFDANAAAICAVNCALLIGVKTNVTFDPGYAFS